MDHGQTPEKGTMEDQDEVEIVDPGVKCSVGQTPHRHDETRINIDPNEGG